MSSSLSLSCLRPSDVARWGRSFSSCSNSLSIKVVKRAASLAGGLVATVDQPAVGLQQRGRTEVFLAVPPIAGAGRRAAGAQDALVKTIQLFAILWRLHPFLLGLRRLGLQPGFDGGVLGVEERQVRHQVLQHRLIGQWADLHLAAGNLGPAVGARQGVAAADIHGARAADAFAAGPPERQGRIHGVLDVDQRIQNHRTAGVDIHLEGVPMRVFVALGVVAIDAEGLGLARALRRRMVFALLDAGILGKCEFDHGFGP